MSIKRKIESVGTPLKNWNIQIYGGVLTGLNEAFIISSEKREEILDNCLTKEERARTDEVIRPILRGKDIKRYEFAWNGLYLCWIPWHFPLHLDPSIQGASEKAEKAFKQEYPALYNHLLNFKELLSKRNAAETGIRYEWYALQRWGANYWDDFNKQKICWNRIASEKQFALVPEGVYILDSMHFIVGKNLNYLCSVLNSKLIQWLLNLLIGDAAGGNAGNADNVLNLSIPLGKNDVKITDETVYRLYGLTPDEIKYVELNS